MNISLEKALLDEEIFGLDVTVLFHDGLVVGGEFHCLVVHVDGS